MTTWYVTEKLGPTRYKTPEGFLVCESVPIARTGVMVYGPGEVPIEPGKDGIVRIERTAEDVFASETISSFAGKPVTDDHPDEDINTSNWARYAKGEVHNPRRGDGIWADCLVADLMIKDEDAIDAVLGGKVEVSCGYDADYEVLSPGVGRQRNIIGNHVALVENGRCGPRCSIGDKAMGAKRKGFADRIRAAFKARDEAAEQLETVLKEGDVMDEEAPAGGTHVHVHLNGAEKAEADTTAADEGVGEDPLEARFAKIESAIAALAEQIGKIVAAKTEPEKAAEEAPEDKGAKTDDEDPEGVKEDKEATGKTADAAGLAPEFADTIARAEILAPGIKLPTFDAKADATKVRDNLCGLRRKALSAALEDESFAEDIAPLVDGGVKAIKAMTCDAVRIAFVGASEIVRRANNSRVIGFEKSTRDQSTVKVLTPAEINKANAEFWSKRT